MPAPLYAPMQHSGFLYAHKRQRGESTIAHQPMYFGQPAQSTPLAYANQQFPQAASAVLQQQIILADGVSTLLHAMCRQCCKAKVGASVYTPAGQQRLVSVSKEMIDQIKHTHGSMDPKHACVSAGKQN